MHHRRRRGCKPNVIHCPIVNAPPTRHRRIMHHRRRRGCKPNVAHCPVANAPSMCHPSIPVCKFPFRDAMIIAMTIFFSYWMQRTASQMQSFSQTPMD